MELELEAGGGGRVVSLSSESPATDLGSGDLVPAPAPRADRTVSRRHVSLRLVGDGGEPRVAFEVVGRNPVVFRSSVGAEKVYRRGEAGELREGDGLSLSLKAPSFWTVRRTDVKGEAEVDAAVLEAVERREKRTRERKEKERERQAVEESMEVAEERETAAPANDELDDEELEDLKIDLENIDPVQEFGFLSMGHEFDNYPKGRIRAPKDWNWFLEETKKSSDDEDDDDDDIRNTRRKSRGGSHVNKKKKNGEAEDEEWTDESEDGKDSQQSGPSVKRPKKYVTRSKDPKKPRKENCDKTEKEDTADDETEEEDEEDETLGGFIVQEDDEPMEELSEEEEDEFDDEDEDDRQRCR